MIANTIFELLHRVQNLKKNVLAFLIATSRSDGGYLPEEQARPILEHVAGKGLAFMKTKVDRLANLALFSPENQVAATVCGCRIAAFF
jgi:hypothetical protein